MNLVAIYEGGNISRYQLEEILLYLENHPEKFREIVDISFSVESKSAFRAMWTVEKVSQRHPEWFTDKMVKKILERCLETSHPGIHRLLLSVIKSLPVPDPLPVELLNSLYDWMLIPKYSIGVQSLAMKVLYNWVRTQPDLLREFVSILQEADLTEYTAAFVASRRNILKHYK